MAQAMEQARATNAAAAKVRPKPPLSAPALAKAAAPAVAEPSTAQAAPPDEDEEAQLSRAVHAALVELEARLTELARLAGARARMPVFHFSNYTCSIYQSSISLTTVAPYASPPFP